MRQTGRVVPSRSVAIARLRAARASLALLAATVVIAAFTAACASGGAAGSGARRSSCPLRSQDSVYLAGGPVFRDCAVDRRATLRNSDLQPQFRPTHIVLGTACYAAEFEFVVASSGLPELATVHLIRANDPDFGDAVTRLVPQLHYSPALRDGTPVRQIVDYKRTLQTAIIAVPPGGSPTPPQAPPPNC